MMPLQQHMCNGLARPTRPANKSVLALDRQRDMVKHNSLCCYACRSIKYIILKYLTIHVNCIYALELPQEALDAVGNDQNV